MNLYRIARFGAWTSAFLIVGFTVSSIWMSPTRDLFLSLWVSTQGSPKPIRSGLGSVQPITSGPKFAPSIATSQPNVLEIPKASLDFIGDWGGYETGTFQYAFNGFAVRVPANKTSATFGRTNGTVFLSLQFWGAPDLENVRKPKAWIIDPKKAVVEWEFQDYQHYIVDVTTYQLRSALRISYRDESKIYDRSSRQLLGVRHTHATLKRLTPDEAKSFEEPPPGWVPKGDLSASKNFSSSGNDDQSISPP